MSGPEVVDEVTSEELTVDEMLELFDRDIKSNMVENPKRYDGDCKGNILTECMREGLKELETASGASDVDYAVIGGIGTQLRGFADCEDILLIGDHFGRRRTADIDILVEDYGEGVSLLTEYNKHYDPLPVLDVVSGHIPGDHEIIENAEIIDFEYLGSDFDFNVKVPTNEDLIYSKVWDPSLEKKRGTNYDLEKISELSGYVFDVNEEELRNMVKNRAPDMEASINYLIRAGIDI